MIREQEGEPALKFTMDLHSEVTDRESAVIAFYKRKRNKWAAELSCVLEGTNIYSFDLEDVNIYI